MVGEQGGDPMVIGTVLAVVFVVLSVTLVSLLLSARIMGFMGETGANVVSRVLGVILAALAVETNRAILYLGQTNGVIQAATKWCWTMPIQPFLADFT